MENLNNYLKSNEIEEQEADKEIEQIMHNLRQIEQQQGGQGECNIQLHSPINFELARTSPDWLQEALDSVDRDNEDIQIKDCNLPMEKPKIVSNELVQGPAREMEPFQIVVKRRSPPMKITTVDLISPEKPQKTSKRKQSFSGVIRTEEIRLKSPEKKKKKAQDSIWNDYIE